MNTEIKPKERPILFSTQMVQAILGGMKTQTRRLKGLELINIYPDEWEYEGFEHGRHHYLKNDRMGHHPEIGICREAIKCHYGEPGTTLWVREAFTKERKYPNAVIDHPNAKLVNYVYKADKQPHVAKIMKWKPPIFMPKKAARIWLKVNRVRIERLQDISEEDAIAEGVELTAKLTDDGNDYTGLHATEHFRELWESINGKESWKANPWVWVIDFQKTEKQTL